MPTLKWELKDKESCRGCQWLTGKQYIYGCVLGLRNLWMPEVLKGIARPQPCIDELGE